jgi:hypothetical protein
VRSDFGEESLTLSVVPFGLLASPHPSRLGRAWCYFFSLRPPSSHTRTRSKKSGCLAKIRGTLVLADPRSLGVRGSIG